MKKIKYLCLLFSISFAISCEENITTECEEEKMNTAVLTKFSDIQKNVFDTNCALSGCHAGTFLSAGLNLSNGKSYEALVNKTSSLNSNYKLVEPGNSENSFIIKMLKNTGERTTIMPPSGKLKSSVIDSISGWINRGALNN
ncbi:MAG: hypothetical protein HYS24_04305 [Ignavibacteriales bacterium]|nr:hypothetical protein [Ignavibacteriales bacterium]